MARTILVVEDNPLMQRRYRAMLGNCDVLVAETAEQGVALARERQPDAVVMDIVLPGMSGIEATRVLKGDESTRTIPVIAVTGLAVSNDVEQIFAAGADAYLPKPIMEEMFLDTLKSCLAA